MGTLYLIATPIGNLEDISARALRLLREARLVAAEDTRQSGKLLEHFGIHNRLVSYHEHNKISRLDQILAELALGDVALISDAGTPGINDPGYELVQAVLQAGCPVSPVPGPSAPLAALVASGLPTHSFLYLGYLPRRGSERKRLLAEVAAQPHTLIFLETPHRLLESLVDLQQGLGDRPCAAARELTKLHEEIFRGSLSQAQAHFTAQAPRGEFTLVIGGAEPESGPWPEERLRRAIAELKMQNLPPGKLAGQLAAQSGWPRSEIYALLQGETDA